MKTSRALTSIVLIQFLISPAIGRSQPVSNSAPADATGYAVTQVGPNSIIWQNAAGQNVTAIATGMNYWNGNQWAASVAAFVPAADGNSFVASQLQDPTTLAADLNVQGAVTVQTPEKVTLQSTPIAVGLFDAASGKSVIVATLTNCNGVQADAQDIVYNNALVGSAFSASVVYSLPDCGSFHQDIVFTAFNQDFNPTNWGFLESSTNTLQIQIFTEFYNNPTVPLYVTNVIYEETNQALAASMASPNLVDYTLDFGHYVFGPGFAYTGSINQGGAAKVAKDFVTQDGRTFLVESVPFQWLENSLRSLPPVAANAKSPRHPLTFRRTMLASMPSLPPKAKPSQKRRISSSTAPSVAPKPVATVSKPKGVTVDYWAKVSSTVESTVFAADTTYFVVGNVTCSGATTMESAVFKFPTNTYAITIEGTLTLTTTNYRPAIVTSADDDSSGTTLSGIYSNYTGTPTGYYGGSGGAIFLDTSANFSLNNFRFCYLRCGLGFQSVSTSQMLGVSHSQFVNCKEAFNIEGNTISNSNTTTLTLTIDNCLMANVYNPFVAGFIDLTASAYNCTIDSASELFNNASNVSGAFGFTNCIFSSITSQGLSEYLTIAGADNAFYSATAFGSSYTILGSSPYVSAWAGNYYLPSTSTLLTAGTTSIPASLLAQLQMKTTEAPLTLTNNFTNYTVLYPIVQRDLAGTALGFHYDPIDYFSDFSVSNTMLLLTNGVAVAYYDGMGIELFDNAQLVSQGTPNYRNYIAYYNMVQEQPTNISGAPNTVAVAQAMPIVPWPTNSANKPTIFLRLTTICAPQGETNILNTADSNKVVSSLALRDCEIYGAGANWIMNETNNIPIVGLTNNVFHRVPVAITNNATLSVYNNLFYGTTNTNEFAIIIQARNTNTAEFTIQNNVFDGVKVALDGTSVGTYGYNAYVHGASNTNGTTNSTDLWSSLSWLGGPLGAYYQTNTSPLLTNGSTYATNLGLYHYTVETNLASGNQIVDGPNLVSRGYHYIALGSNDLPTDTNGDGVPDYLEDANGNGVVDSGEIDWLLPGDMGLTVTITQPMNNSQVP